MLETLTDLTEGALLPTDLAVDTLPEITVFMLVIILHLNYENANLLILFFRLFDEMIIVSSTSHFS